jgi:hypothetical protein
VDKTTTLNDAQNEKSNSSANEAQKTRPFSFLGYEQDDGFNDDK